jgi:hypothetical protein
MSSNAIVRPSGDHTGALSKIGVRGSAILRTAPPSPASRRCRA